MGCGASKATTVAPDGNHLAAGKSKNSHNATRVSPISNENITSDDDISLTARASQGLAFEVPLDESNENSTSSLIKKHPPKRLQRLEEPLHLPPLTHELLDEKQAEAEQRRQQILNQRVQSAKARQKLKRNILHNGENNENGLLIESLNREPSTIEI